MFSHRHQVIEELGRFLQPINTVKAQILRGTRLLRVAEIEGSSVKQAKSSLIIIQSAKDIVIFRNRFFDLYEALSSQTRKLFRKLGLESNLTFIQNVDGEIDSSNNDCLNVCLRHVENLQVSLSAALKTLNWETAGLVYPDEVVDGADGVLIIILPTAVIGSLDDMATAASGWQRAISFAYSMAGHTPVDTKVLEIKQGSIELVLLMTEAFKLVTALVQGALTIGGLFLLCAKGAQDLALAKHKESALRNALRDADMGKDIADLVDKKLNLRHREAVEKKAIELLSERQWEIEEEKNEVLEKARQCITLLEPFMSKGASVRLCLPPEIPDEISEDIRGIGENIQRDHRHILDLRQSMLRVKAATEPLRLRNDGGTCCDENLLDNQVNPKDIV